MRATLQKVPGRRETGCCVVRRSQAGGEFQHTVIVTPEKLRSSLLIRVCSSGKCRKAFMDAETREVGKI